MIDLSVPENSRNLDDEAPPAMTHAAPPDRVRGFRVSIRVTHPKIPLGLITRQIGRTPDIAWTAGAQRVAPKGTVLPGLRKDSYWVLKGPESDDLASLIDWANGVMQKRQAFCSGIAQYGRKIGILHRLLYRWTTWNNPGAAADREVRRYWRHA
ncbi:MAG: hypothetical protein LBU11_04180 [Zoogloeaceae bacterium]|jgi:hypothetical protein|nr:hypothetical protein [Zoogloeaceae bacterium]